MEYQNLLKNWGLESFIAIFEGDPFAWLLEWATRLFRSPFQRYFAGLCFYMHNLALCLILIYGYLTKPKAEEVGEYLATASSMAFLSLTYGTLMRNYETINAIVQTIRKLYLDGTRPPSEFLKKEVYDLSSKLKILFNFICNFLPLMCYICFLIFEDKHKHVVFVIVRKCTLGRIGLQALLFGVVVPPSIIFISVPLLLNSYVSFTITYLLKMIDEQMELLNNFETDQNHIADCLDSVTYQKRIREDMIYVLTQFGLIRKATNMYIDFVKWRFLCSVLVGGVLIGTLIVFMISIRSERIITYCGMLLTTAIFVYVLADSGTQIHIQCENIVARAESFKWYQWDKNNCQLLMMFYVQTRNPISISCYEFAVQNRELLVEVYRMSYAYITFFQSIK